MKKQNQISNHTEYDRTPEIFKAAASLFPNLKILSFGCSTGLETASLSDIYFPCAEIHGYDIDKDIIKSNKLKNKHKNITYFDDPDLLSKDYDIIFCMSVLCRWPDNQENYTFDLFNETLLSLDQKLKLGGYLVVYNSQYLITDSAISNKYSPINTDTIDSGFVTKWDSDFKNILNDNQPVIYKKTING